MSSFTEAPSRCFRRPRTLAALVASRAPAAVVAFWLLGRRSVELGFFPDLGLPGAIRRLCGATWGDGRTFEEPAREWRAPAPTPSGAGAKVRRLSDLTGETQGTGVRPSEPVSPRQLRVTSRPHFPGLTGYRDVVANELSGPDGKPIPIDSRPGLSNLSDRELGLEFASDLP